VLSGFVGHRLLPNVVWPPLADPDWRSASLTPLLATLETRLRTNAFLAGPHLTIADFSVAGMVTYFRSAEFPFDAYPHLARWYGAIEALDAWQSTASPLWTP